MTAVEATVTIPQEGMTLEEAETKIGQALQETGRQLLKQAAQVMEAALLQRAGEGLQRNKARPRYLLSRFGWVRVKCYQVRDGPGHYLCPLDNLLSLQPRQHASPWITQHAIALATRLPSRQFAFNFIYQCIERFHKSTDLILGSIIDVYPHGCYYRSIEGSRKLDGGGAS